MDTFVVLGQPVPQGSMKHVGGGRIVSKSPKLKEWREKIAQVVRDQVGEPAHRSAVSVTAVFIFNKPKTVQRDRPTVPPDLDKLQRALGDAISIDVKYLIDDSQIVDWHSEKVYGAPAGVVFTVKTL
jgi:Holliday junction resolvase RusA-like endonuclease